MKVGIVGLGLIGGSVGLGLKESGLASEVWGFDRDARVRIHALEKGAVQQIVNDPKELGNSQVLLLATPPEATVMMLAKLESSIGETCAVSDTCSVKQAIVDSVPASLRNRYVGGHPMAGNEHVGLEHASASLFLDAAWVITPGADVENWALKRIQSLIYSLDARPVTMTPQEHDRHVALLSHLPHALGALLVQMADALQDPSIAGGSWRDLTRVAGSHPKLWREILTMNKPMLLGVLQGLRSEIRHLETLLEEDDSKGLLEILENANLVRVAHEESRKSMVQ